MKTTLAILLMLPLLTLSAVRIPLKPQKPGKHGNTVEVADFEDDFVVEEMDDFTLRELQAIDQASNSVADIAGGAVTAVGSLVKVKAKLAAPLLALGAKLTAPIVAIKSKLAVPLVFVGAKLAKPIVKTKAKLAAPVLKLGLLGAKGVADLTKPLAGGIADSLSPATDALQPLSNAVQPSLNAGLDGLSGINFQEIIDNVDFDAEFNGVTAGTGRLFKGVGGLGQAGAQFAFGGALDLDAEAGGGSFNSVDVTSDTEVVIEEEGDSDVLVVVDERTDLPEDNEIPETDDQAPGAVLPGAGAPGVGAPGAPGAEDEDSDDEDSDD